MYRYAAVILALIQVSSFTLKGQDLKHIQVDSINSSYDEHSPVLAPDGNRLYFTRSGHPANIGGVLDRGDIWYAEKKNEGWSQPIHAGNIINHSGLNGVVGFSADGKVIYLLNYFDKNERGGGKLKNGVSKSNLANGEWLVPERLSIRYFSNSSSHISASISRDEKVLILAIQSYETEGNEDLYVSLKGEDGEWSQPKNLGPVINTYAEEWTPFLDSDNETLYFTSNGHEGVGSRDIFRSKRKDGSWTNWSTPENLGSSLNTQGVEQGYFIPETGNIAFFSSTQNSEGFGDLFGFPISREIEEKSDTMIIEEEVEPIITTPVVKVSKPVVAMTFQVLDKRTEKPVDAKVLLTYAEKEVEIKTSEIDSEIKKFMVTFEEGVDVNVNIEADGYLKYQEIFKASATPQTIDEGLGGGVENFMLTPEEVGTKVEIENILFNRANFTFAEPDVAKKQIDEVITLMTANPGMAIRLEGHTDNRGNAKLLKELSEKRVKTVRDYMISRGISANRIEYIGYGGEKPITDNTNVEGREVNRRVEFVIIK